MQNTQQNQPSHEIVMRPVPVILAASRQRRLWPFSTPAEPFCLREISGRPSLLVRNLQALEASAAFDRPIVILAEEAAMRGVFEVRRLRPDALILIVPSGTGSGLSSVLAALLVGPCPMALIPASFTADNPIQAMQFLAKQIARSGTGPMMLSARANGFRDGVFLELGERLGTDSDRFTLTSLFVRGQSELASVLAETSSLAKASGPVGMNASYLVGRLKENWPTLLSACRNALAMKQDSEQFIRPNGDFLRLAGRPGIGDLLQAVLKDVEAVIGRPDWRTVQTFRDPLFDGLQNEDTGTFGVCGYPDHRVIASKDGTLILKPGHEDEAKNYFPETGTTTAKTSVRTVYPTIRFSA